MKMFLISVGYVKQTQVNCHMKKPYQHSKQKNLRRFLHKTRIAESNSCWNDLTVTEQITFISEEHHQAVKVTDM